MNLDGDLYVNGDPVLVYDPLEDKRLATNIYIEDLLI